MPPQTVYPDAGEVSHSGRDKSLPYSTSQKASKRIFDSLKGRAEALP